MKSRLFSAFSLVVLTVPAIFGQATRTWVSGVGDDVNPCSRTAPCKTWAGAIVKTDPGGEIDALDPGGFGGVTITKSITIDGGGFTAGVLVGSTNGIVIAAAGTDAITLRGLDFNGTGTGLDGIKVLTGGTVRVEESRIYHFTQWGINAAANQATPINLSIRNTIIKDCLMGAVTVNPSGGAVASLAINGLEAHGNPVAINATGTAKVTARGLELSENTTGVTAGASSIINLDGGSIAFTTTAVSAAGGTIRISDMSITDNTTGLATSNGGTILSFTNNRILGNGTDGSPSLSFYQR